MFSPVEQGIEVPKITLEDEIPQRAVLREPLPVAPGCARARDSYSGTRQARTWRRLVPRRCAGGRRYWWMGCTHHVQRRPPGEGFTASPGRYTITGRQSESYLGVNVPQLQFIVRLLVFSCATETGTHSANSAGIRDSSAVLG